MFGQDHLDAIAQAKEILAHWVYEAVNDTMANALKCDRIVTQLRLREARERLNALQRGEDA